MPLRVWTLTVIAGFDVAGSNCLSCEHKREVFGKHRVKRERERGRERGHRKKKRGQYSEDEEEKRKHLKRNMGKTERRVCCQVCQGNEGLGLFKGASMKVPNGT